MQLRRLLFSSALLFAACASNDKVEPGDPAKPPEAVTPGLAPTTVEAPKPKSLKSAMKGIEDDFHRIEKALEGDPSGDLPAIAAAATRVAGVMKLAYDPFEDAEVPDFAKLAREAEAGLLEFAKAAGAGDVESVKKLGKTLQSQHCARCHDAVEEAKG